MDSGVAAGACLCVRVCASVRVVPRWVTYCGGSDGCGGRLFLLRRLGTFVFRPSGVATRRLDGSTLPPAPVQFIVIFSAEQVGLYWLVCLVPHFLKWLNGADDIFFQWMCFFSKDTIFIQLSFSHFTECVYTYFVFGLTYFFVLWMFHPDVFLFFLFLSLLPVKLQQSFYGPL